MPHVLEKTNHSFALSGRDEALNSAANAFRDLPELVEAFDRIQRKIPVCIWVKQDANAEGEIPSLA